MSTIVTRAAKGSALTHTEVDANFTNLNTDKLQVGSGGLTSSVAELNILDGVTSTAAELNILDGVTSSAAELNILDGVTATAAEINTIVGNTSGSYTGTATGMTTSPTNTIYYRIVGGIVHLRMDSNLSGTSNANTFTITGAPAGIRPDVGATFGIVIVTDNGQINTAYGTMNTSGTIILTRPVFGVAWTTSGTKALQPFCASYMLTHP